MSVFVMKESYLTLAGSGTSEFRDRGSKFLGFVFPLGNAAEARAVLTKLRAEHPKANHHCLAYRLGDDIRASDEGEPAGSAGRPMLGALDAAGLDQVGALVVRYFGGTLLGVPGLIHAYKTCVSEALAGVARVEKWVEIPYQITCNYDHLGDVLRVLRTLEATVISQDLQLFCTVNAGVRIGTQEAFKAALQDFKGVEVRK
jgi:uncharacterized YigZ family protein